MSGREKQPQNIHYSDPKGCLITLDMLREHFHQPLQSVASEFGMCITKFKKICRILGIVRWPQRKVLSFNNIIEQLESSLESGNHTETQRAKIIERLRIVEAKKKMLYDNPNLDITITPSTVFQKIDDPSQLCTKRQRPYDLESKGRETCSKKCCSSFGTITPNPTIPDLHYSSQQTFPLPPLEDIVPGYEPVPPEGVPSQPSSSSEMNGIQFDALCASMPSDLQLLPSLTLFLNASPSLMEKYRKTRIPLFFSNVPRIELELIQH